MSSGNPYDKRKKVTPTPAPKVGDGFVPVPRALIERAAGMVESYSARVSAYVKADDIERWDYTPAIDDLAAELRSALAAAPAPVADTAPERDPRNAPQVGDVCHSMYGTWTVVAKNHDGSLRCHVKDESAYSDRETTVPIENWQFKLYSDERWLTHEQYAAEKEK